VRAEVADNYEMYQELSLFLQEVKCPHCGEIILENWCDCISSKSSSERNMGTEVIYNIECDNYHCPNCERTFMVEGFICTYPDGAYETHEIKTFINPN